MIRQLLLVAACGAALTGAGFVAGSITAPQSEPLYIPTESRADCLEVRLVPDDRGDGLMVRAWLWDNNGRVRWTRDLREDEPLATLWDGTDKGQEAVDLSHWYAEWERERCDPNLHYLTETAAGSMECY